MGAIVPGLAYETQGTTLANTNKTACLTVGAGRAADCAWVEVVGIAVTDSSGAVLTPALVHWYDGATERVLVPTTTGLPTPAEDLVWPAHEGDFIHLETGGEIRVTGASGHHVRVTFVKGQARGAAAQGYAGRR